MHLPYMIANPHLYDYLHDLRFADDGTVELVDGAGQRFNAVARGRYRTRDIDRSTAEVTFFDLSKVDPSHDYARIGELPDITVHVTREAGVYPFLREIAWKLADRASHPALLYRTRYIFTVDPLAFAQATSATNLYQVAEPKELVDSARHYYPRDEGQELTYRDLLALGIPAERILPTAN